MSFNKLPTKKRDNVVVRSFTVCPTFSLSEEIAIKKLVVRALGRRSNGQIPCGVWIRELVLKELEKTRGESK